MAQLGFAFRVACRASRFGTRTANLWRHNEIARGTARFFTTKLEIISEAPNHIDVGETAEDGKSVVLSKLWLRDCCRCEECVDKETMQRKFNILAYRQDGPMSVESKDDDGFVMRFPDHHTSRFTWDWVREQLPGFEILDMNPRKSMKLWNREILLRELPEVEYSEVMDPSSQEGMAKLCSKIRQSGICFVTGTPVTPEATKELIESIGPIRQTHYGGFYDFQADHSKADSAYTNAALDLHTDTTYFTEPAGIQALHLLSHTPSSDEPSDEKLGGETILVDGFFVAHRQRMEFRSHFDLLQRAPVRWHASGNADVAVIPDKDYPIIGTHLGVLQQIRWNMADRGFLSLDVHAGKMIGAMRSWDSIMRRPENKYQFQLAPGRVLLMDNWRILHGRTAFTGDRRICGAYISRDDFVSKWKLTNFDRKEVSEV
ncbi:hypothetical protein XA68_12569 [Ophiocordyceps unilateralis]|uniref:trimethyllysine dioxygenase n=1 Tax=Ophiocordyceps unilateralis TaxID=268505 RepID=A0A2A9PEQ4_OPHUN|nr:hypothetical protein XA68_12569 [Ophiocordyceps unilateralis]